MKLSNLGDKNWLRKALLPLLLLGSLFWVFVLPDIMGFERWPNIRNLYTTPVGTIAGAESMYVVRDFIAKSIREGSLPQWLPTESLGIPIALQYCWQIYNPLEWLWWIDIDAWRTMVLWLYLFASGLGLYGVMRKHFNSSGPASLSAAFIYCLTGFAIWYYTYWYYITILLPLPFVLLFSLNLLKRHNVTFSFIGLTISNSLILLHGQPQSIFCCGLGVIVFILVFMFKARSRLPSALNGALLLLATMALSIAITSWQTVPFFTDSFRGENWSQHLPEVGLSTAPRKTAIVNLFKITSPYLRGTANTAWFVSLRLTNTVSEDFAFSLGVTGCFLLFIATFGAFLKKQNSRWSAIVIQKQQSVIITFYAIFFVIAWHALAPLRYDFWPFPFANFSRYFVPLLTLLGGIAVGLGVDWLARLRVKLWVTSLIASCAIPTMGGLVIMLSAERISNPGQAVHSIFLTVIPIAALLITLFGLYALSGWNFNRLRTNNNLLGSFAVIVFAESFYMSQFAGDFTAAIIYVIPYILLYATAVLLLLRRHRWAVAAVSTSVFLFVVWFTAVNRPQSRFDPERAERYTAAADFLKHQMSAQAQEGYRPRILPTCRWELYVGFNSHVGIDNLVAFIPIMPFTWGGYLFDFLHPKIMETNRLLTLPNMYCGMCPTYSGMEKCQRWADYFKLRHFYHVLGVTHLLNFKGGSLDETLSCHPEWGTDLELVYETPNSMDRGQGYILRIYKDKHALPRAYFTSSFGLVPKTKDGWAAREWMWGNQETIREKPVVELDYASMPKFASIVYPLREPFLSSRYYNNAFLFENLEYPENGIIGQKITSYKPNEVRISVNAPRQGLLVLNDAYHPNWRVTINNESKPLVRVNSIVRGVFVRSGQHEVVFSYKPYGNFVKWLPLVGIISMMVFAVVLYHHGKQHLS